MRRSTSAAYVPPPMVPAPLRRSSPPIPLADPARPPLADLDIPAVRSRASTAGTSRSTLGGRGGGGARAGGLAAVGLVDRLDQLPLRHPGPALHAQPLGDVEQVRLRRVRVHAAGGLRRALAAAAGRLRVRRPLGPFGLPVVADLLERVLERGERRAVRPLPLAVRLHRRV